MAIMHDNLDSIEYLLSYGANTRTLRPANLRYLISEGVNVNWRTLEGDTLLHVAAKTGSVDKLTF